MSDRIIIIESGLFDGIKEVMYGNIISSNIDIQRKEIFRKDFIMIFSIKNIGIIKSADVKMDGLTVISVRIIQERLRWGRLCIRLLVQQKI